MVFTLQMITLTYLVFYENPNINGNCKGIFLEGGMII